VVFLLITITIFPSLVVVGVLNADCESVTTLASYLVVVGVLNADIAFLHNKSSF
jgi:hypothetical protein